MLTQHWGGVDADIADLLATLFTNLQLTFTQFFLRFPEVWLPFSTLFGYHLANLWLLILPYYIPHINYFLCHGGEFYVIDMSRIYHIPKHVLSIRYKSDSDFVFFFGGGGEICSLEQ